MGGYTTWTAGKHQRPRDGAILLAEQRAWEAAPRVFHTEEGDEGTVYHLRVNGVFVASAHWPHPLYAMEPTAVSGGEMGGAYLEVAPPEDGFGFLGDWTH